MSWWHLLIVLLLGCQRSGDSAEVAEDDSADHATSGQHVVVLVLDGVRLEETLGADSYSVNGLETSEILSQIRAELFPEGALVLPGLALGPTKTAPSHCALLTGQRTPYENASGSIEGSYRPVVPTLFELVEATESMDAMLVANTVHLEGLNYSTYPGHGVDDGADYRFLSSGQGNPLGSDAEVITRLKRIMNEQEPNLVVVNLHQMDREGHNGTEENYVNEIQSVDQPIVDFWNWLQSNPRYANQTTLMLVSDHGRHRNQSEFDWTDHGDSCRGCREIPMFLIGPNIQSGVTVETGRSLTDIAQTIAWILDVNLPYGTGEVISEVLDVAPDGPSRSGDVAVTAVLDTTGAELVATQRWNDDVFSRSKIYRNEERVSTEGVLHAEEPHLFSQNGADVLCWRELALDLQADDLPWIARCQYRASGGDWVEMEFDDQNVHPYWYPAIEIMEDGSVWMASTHLPDNRTKEVHLRVWDPVKQNWMGERDALPDLLGPLSVSMTVREEDVLVAFGASTDSAAANETRSLFLYQIEALGSSREWSLMARVVSVHSDVEADGTTIETDYGRLERPALWHSDSGIHLAAIAYNTDHSSQIITLSGESDAWSEPVEHGDRVLGHLSPRWTEDGILFWARLGDGGFVEICQWSAGADSHSCDATKHAYISGLSITLDWVYATLSSDGVNWDVAVFER